MIIAQARCVRHLTETIQQKDAHIAGLDTKVAKQRIEYKVLTNENTNLKHIKRKLLVYIEHKETEYTREIKRYKAAPLTADHCSVTPSTVARRSPRPRKSPAPAHG